jgi:hypothetical protein
MFNKVTSRPYGYFLKFSYFFRQRNGYLQVGQKPQKLVKKIEGILGVKGIEGILGVKELVTTPFGNS